MRMPEDNQGLAPAYSRYRALLDVSAALVVAQMAAIVNAATPT
jgi:hypothetical protein